MKKRSRCFFGSLTFLLFFSSLSSLSCARQAPAEKTKPLLSSSASSDAAADATLGALSEDERTETEKQLEEFEQAAESERAVRELRKREKEEAERHLERSVTEDQIVGTLP